MRTETENSLQTDMNFLFAARYKVRRKIITLQSKGRRRQLLGLQVAPKRRVV